MAKKPTHAKLFAFNVGFGDCLLLRFVYAGGENRHALIDFGSMARSEHQQGDMEDVANKIAELCEGELDLLVATHRHKDHISGFATKANGRGSGDIIAGLNPKLVLQPWTEDPDAAQDATRATMHGFLSSLDAMSSVAAAAHRFSASRAGLSAETRRSLAFVGEDNVKNPSAVRNLIAMGQNAEHEARYLKFDDEVDLSDILPGVTLHVLGPPDLKQSDAIRTQRAKHADEFWHLRGATAETSHRGDAPNPLFPDLVEELPVYARWVAERASDVEGELLHSIVTALDRQMNNTSLILLFEAGGKKLLFPGDAQWENWEFALGQEKVRALLADVDLYKVGHHGSLNATPKSLWKLFRKKGGKSKKGRLRSMMSTLAGHHGGENDAPTEVPREPLVDELKAKSALETTEGKLEFAEHDIPLS